MNTMIAQQTANVNERTLTVLWANTWGYSFLAFALLADIMYRSFVFREAAWDLFALLGLGGIVSIVYAARHKVPLLNRQSLAVMVLVAVIAAVVGALLAMTKAM